MNNFIVTGAAGHIGNNLVRKLNGLSITPKCIILPNEDVSSLNGVSYETCYGDVTDKSFLEQTIPENSTVIHLAGIIDITSEKNELLNKVNVGGVKNIADVCLAKNSRLIYVSSVHAILEGKHKSVMSEPKEFYPEKVVGAYAKSKAAATKYVFDMVKKGLKATVIYPSGVIGKNDFKISNTGKLIIDIANKDIKTRVNGGYNFVDVEDIVDGIILALDKGKIGEGYILCSGIISIDGIFKTVNNCLGRTKYIPKLATSFVKIFSHLAELYYKVRGQKPLFTRYSLYTITSNHNFDNTKAKTELGFNPKLPEEAIVSALEWFINNRKDLFKAEVLKEYEKTKNKEQTK